MMSEYELSLLRQRGLAARDSKARRGELRFALPPGYCWNEIGQIEIDPDERIADAIRLVQGTRQRTSGMRRNLSICMIEWRPAAYHTVLQILQHPIYAGA